MESALEEQKGQEDEVKKTNKIRSTIKKFFTVRKCFTLCRPVDSKNLMKRLPELENYELDEEFKYKIGNIRSHIFGNMRPKALNGIRL